jgi:NAD(P)-dependent dehydrogenase (short-subunit alcohol dehydrogenase family)
MVAGVGIGRLPQAVHAASKGSLEAITREWASQWSRYGIRINNLAPGFIETEMTEGIIHRDNIRDWILRNTLLPMRSDRIRIYKPDGP